MSNQNEWQAAFQSPEDPKPEYAFELTTTFFAIDNTGSLVANEENLDRDPPSPGRFRFQVVARERTGTAASAPLSFVVTLNDVNDNAPVLPMMQPIAVQAGETKREVVKVNYSNIYFYARLRESGCFAESWNYTHVDQAFFLPLIRGMKWRLDFVKRWNLKIFQFFERSMDFVGKWFSEAFERILISSRIYTFTWIEII